MQLALQIRCLKTFHRPKKISMKKNAILKKCLSLEVPSNIPLFRLNLFRHQSNRHLQGVSSVGRAPPLQGGCRRFESCTPYHLVPKWLFLLDSQLLKLPFVSIRLHPMKFLRYFFTAY